MADKPTGKPANWYPDPEKKKKLRYWDGARWTDHWIAKPEGRRAALPPPPDLSESPISTLPTAPPHFSFDDEPEDDIDAYQNPWAEKRSSMTFEPFEPRRDPEEVQDGKKTKKAKKNKPGKPPKTGAAKSRSKLIMILVPLIVVAAVIAFAFLVILPKMAPTPPPKIESTLTAEVPDVAGKTLRRGAEALVAANFNNIVAKNAAGKEVTDAKGWRICSTLPIAGETVETNAELIMVVGSKAKPCPKS